LESSRNRGVIELGITSEPKIFDVSPSSLPLGKKAIFKVALNGEHYFLRSRHPFKAFKNNQEYFSFFSFSLFVARSSPAGPANCTKNNWDHKIFSLKLTIDID